MFPKSGTKIEDTKNGTFIDRFDTMHGNVYRGVRIPLETTFNDVFGYLMGRTYLRMELPSKYKEKRELKVMLRSLTMYRWARKEMREWGVNVAEDDIRQVYGKDANELKSGNLYENFYEGKSSGYIEFLKHMRDVGVELVGRERVKGWEQKMYPFVSRGGSTEVGKGVVLLYEENGNPHEWNGVVYMDGNGAMVDGKRMEKGWKYVDVRCGKCGKLRGDVMENQNVEKTMQMYMERVECEKTMKRYQVICPEGLSHEFVGDKCKKCGYATRSDIETMLAFHRKYWKKEGKRTRSEKVTCVERKLDDIERCTIDEPMIGTVDVKDGGDVDVMRSYRLYGYYCNVVKIVNRLKPDVTDVPHAGIFSGKVEYELNRLHFLLQWLRLKDAELYEDVAGWIRDVDACGKRSNAEDVDMSLFAKKRVDFDMTVDSMYVEEASKSEWFETEYVEYTDD
jgi:hypothetical protein